MSLTHSTGAALLMEMGTGKSLTAIAITGALSNAGRIRRALVVAPLSILGVWESEFEKFAAFPYALALLTGPTEKRGFFQYSAAGDSKHPVTLEPRKSARLLFRFQETQESGDRL